MTSDLTVLANPWLSDTNDYINEIYDIFNRHWMTLDNERQSDIESINNWCRDWTKRLKTYAKEQKCLLNNHYDRLRLVLDEKNQENLETANAYYTTKKVDLFKQLSDACQRLEFQVAKLEFINREITYPKVIIVEEQTERNNQEQIITDISKNSEQRRNSIAINRSTTEDTTSANASSPSKSAGSSSKKAQYVCISKCFVVARL
jgi:hypothetical protein